MPQESIAGEAVADAVSAVIDRRNVPRRETPLHLAVRLRDPVAAAGSARRRRRALHRLRRRRICLP